MSGPVADALDGIHEALNALIEEIAREIEGCGRYEPEVDQAGDPDMVPVAEGTWLDREDVLSSIRRLAR
jgi:hypothetical protein